MDDDEGEVRLRQAVAEYNRAMTLLRQAYRGEDPAARADAEERAAAARMKLQQAYETIRARRTGTGLGPSAGIWSGDSAGFRGDPRQVRDQGA